MTTLTLPGELNIYGAASLHAACLGWLQAHDGGDCEVDASAVAEVDACGLQLLVALQRSLVAQGRGLVLRAPSATLERACLTLGLASLTEGSLP